MSSKELLTYQPKRCIFFAPTSPTLKPLPFQLSPAWYIAIQFRQWRLAPRFLYNTTYELPRKQMKIESATGFLYLIIAIVA